jgi:uroporphyrinogen decarboxylase
MLSSTRVEALWPHHRPDFERLRRVFYRQSPADRVPFIELFADPEIVAAVLGESPVYVDDNQLDDWPARAAHLNQRIRFCQRAGYDFVWANPRVAFARKVVYADDPAALARPARRWVNEAEGAIMTLADFAHYPWPSPAAVDYFDLEYVAQHLPEGMQMIVATSGILEWVMWLMGFEPFFYALYDQPDLVERMFEQVGGLFAAIYATMAGMPQVGALFLGDDMGHRSGPFVQPAHLRHYVFPHQRRLAQIAHDHGLPFLLHACGNLRLVMDDLIEEVGIDAKHSFEDTYLPVTEAKRLYGDRIALLGGVDVDLLVRGDEDTVRRYTRHVLEACMPGGGYALGTGNSVANYIPVRNYLAMLDEGMRVGSYR